MIDVFPPALAVLLAALASAFCRPAAARGGIAIAGALGSLLLTWQVADGVLVSGSFLGYPLELVEGTALGRLFASFFALALIAGVVYALRTASRAELVAAQVYAAGAMGVAFAGDLITLFLFWEIMALASVALVWSGANAGARAAGIRYAVIHLVGALILKMGIEGIKHSTGSLDIRPFALDGLDTALLLAGILLNAAAPPLSAWLADAYPRATPTGSVFLSVFTTKTAVLALILLFPGEELLIAVGLYMAFYGILYALLEDNLRRILAYALVTQVGFMVCAIGVGTEAALNAAAAHAATFTLAIALLFMAVGTVILRTGKEHCTDLGGLYRNMPVTLWCTIIGALAIASVPLTGGFVSRSLIADATAGADDLALVYTLLAIAAAGVFLQVGIRLPWLVFFSRDSGLRSGDAPGHMKVAMIALAAGCVVLGAAPQLLYPLLPHAVEQEPYRANNVLFQLQLMMFSGLGFFLLLPWLRPRKGIVLDVDWLWRRGLPELADLLARVIGNPLRRAVNRILAMIDDATAQAQKIMGHAGPLGRSWEIGTTALWIVLLLMVYVFAYYLF